MRGQSNWIDFIEQFRAENPGLSYKDAMIEAAPIWDEMKYGYGYM